MAIDGSADKVHEGVQSTSAPREQATEVARTAKSEVKEVAHEAKAQARSAMHQMMDDTRVQAEDQATKLAVTLHDTSGHLRQMAEAGEPQSIATTLVREGADAAERIASRLESGGAEGALAEVRSFARRSPGVFLFGAAAAGFLTGRLVRNFSSERAQTSQMFMGYEADTQMDLESSAFVTGYDPDGAS